MLAASATLAALLVCAPWTARNCLRMKRCALVSYNGGWNLMVSTGDFRVPDACADVFDEAEKDACFGGAARRMILERPAAWLALAPGKLGGTFDYSGAAPWYLHASNPGAFPLAAKAVAGAAETLLERAALLGALVWAARARHGAPGEPGALQMARRGVAVLGVLFAVTLHAWIGYGAFVLAAMARGLPLWRGPVLGGAAVAVVAATMATHAAFFGLGRHALVVFPLVTALLPLAFGRRLTRALERAGATGAEGRKSATLGGWPRSSPTRSATSGATGGSSAWAGSWLAAAPLLFLLACALAASHLGVALLLGAGSYLLALGLIRLASTWFVDEKRVPVAGHLTVGDRGLRWNGRRMARRSAIAAGFVVQGEEGPVRVRLVRRFRRKPLTCVVPDEATGRAMLTALGLDAAQVAAKLELASLARARPWAVWANLACLVALAPGLPLCLVWAIESSEALLVAALLGLFVLGWTVVTLAPARALVGVDGVLITWLWQRRFVRYEDLDEVRSFIQPKGAGVALALHGGEEIHLPLTGFLTMESGREELSLRVRRIEQALELSRRAQADRNVVLPSRGDRPARRWLEALRAVGSGAAADHRRAPVEPDTLFRIAEDPGSPPERRVAAAVALGDALDPIGRDPPPGRRLDERGAGAPRGAGAGRRRRRVGRGAGRRAGAGLRPPPPGTLIAGRRQP